LTVYRQPVGWYLIDFARGRRTNPARNTSQRKRRLVLVSPARPTHHERNLCYGFGVVAGEVGRLHGANEPAY
jgi:hypothetical protein